MMKSGPSLFGMVLVVLLAAAAIPRSSATAQTGSQSRTPPTNGNTEEPIIDMHLHALPARALGPPPVAICAPFDFWPAWDPKTGGEAYDNIISKNPPCAHPLRSPATDEELMQRTLAIMQARNVIGVTSGSERMVGVWKASGGEHILPAMDFDPASGKPTVSQLRAQAKAAPPSAFAEIGNQYEGIAVNDPRMEPYFALAEELDIPVGIHMGSGPPGTTYTGTPEYRMRLSSLLLLEDVLVNHPKMRVYAMHAGWPLIDDAIAALYAHPQLYVDLGIISYAFPKKDFYFYLHRLIDAGFENRILFGSDEMVWPEALSAGIDTIQQDPNLDEKQKRDILYNNAARFLRLGPPGSPGSRR